MQLLVDAMNDPSLWTALEADQTPSTELGVTAETSLFRYGEDTTSLKVQATSQALNHRLLRTLANLDWRTMDELRFWLRANRTADGSAAKPFYLELRLASGAMSLTNPNNTWYRLLPIAQSGQWELIRLSLRDLPDAIRSAVNLLQVRCITALDFVCHIDDLVVVREELLNDIDQALLARLHNRLRLGNDPVPAFIAHPNQTEPALPHIRLVQYGLQLVPDAQRSTQQKGDFTETGYSVLPASVGYALFYEIEGRATTREVTSRLFEFILQAFSPQGSILSNNVMHRVEFINFAIQEELGPKRAEQLALRFKVYTRQEMGVPQKVMMPYQEVAIAAGFL